MIQIAPGIVEHIDDVPAAVAVPDADALGRAVRAAARAAREVAEMVRERSGPDADEYAATASRLSALETALSTGERRTDATNYATPPLHRDVSACALAASKPGSSPAQTSDFASSGI